MMSSLRGLIYGVVLLHIATAIEFRGYKLNDPPREDYDDELQLKNVDASYVRSLQETRVNLPPDTGTPKLLIIHNLVKADKAVRIISNHTKGTANEVHLVYSQGNVKNVYDVTDGRSTPITCVEGDVSSSSTKKITCVAIASGWMSDKPPVRLFVFQHVVHSRFIAFPVDTTNHYFYILREDDTIPLQLNGANKDATVEILYNDNVEYDEKGPLTLGFLTAKTTTFGKKFALIGQFKMVEKDGSDDKKKPRVNFYKKFFPVKRLENADVSKCMDAYIDLGPTRITFRELEDTIILARNMDELLTSEPIDNCFKPLDSRHAKIQSLTSTLDTPDRSLEHEEITVYEARASPSEPFYGVALSYQSELDQAKHGHHFAMVNNMVVHLDDLRYAGEMLYPLDEYTDVVHLFRSTPAIKLQVLPFDYAFKALPYWMDQCMPHMENEPLHNYYEAISHSGPRFKRYNIWADIIITKSQCVNTSRLNVSLASFAEHHTERVPINGTMETVERDMSETYEEYDDIHVDQRNPCNDINVLSKIKRTTKNLSKKDTIVLEAKDDEPLRMTLNLEEGETFLVRFFNVERDESKCQDLDTVAIFLKDDMLVNQKAYIRTLTYEALTKRNKTWTITGKLTIAIPNGCFRIEVVSVFSIQRAKYLRNIRACVVVMALTIIWSGTAILLYYKFSLAGREYRRLRRLYKRAKRHDNFVRHYLEWKENMEEIIAAWEKVPDDH